MIIVVPIKYFLEDHENDCYSHLAFLDTVTDTFFKFDGTHVFDCWEYLKGLCTDEVDGTVFLERVKGLCPEWFFEEQDDG